MRTITAIGIDVAKKVFQVHGIDAKGKVVVARKLRRKEVLRRHQPHAVPQLGNLTPPIMRAATSLHGDQTRRQLGEERHSRVWRAKPSPHICATCSVKVSRSTRAEAVLTRPWRTRPIPRALPSAVPRTATNSGSLLLRRMVSRSEA